MQHERYSLPWSHGKQLVERIGEDKYIGQPIQVGGEISTDEVL